MSTDRPAVRCVVVEPVEVTTNSQGNVYEADLAYYAPGVVNEYRQHNNTVAATCTLQGEVRGVAVDGRG